MSGIAIIVLISGIAIAMAIIAFAFRLRQVEKEDEPASLQTPADSAPLTPAAAPPAAAPDWIASLASNLQSTASTISNVIPPALKKESELPELAHFYVAPTGRLIIEMNGKRYNSVKEITDPVTARSVKTLVEELNKFFDTNLTVNIIIKEETALPPLSPVLPPIVAATPLIPPSQPQRPVKTVTIEEAREIPLEKPSMDVFQQFRNLRKRELQPEIKIKSVLEEIDDVLQNKITGSELVQRQFKVATATDGTALFMLDEKGYQNVDDLPDTQAREILQQAIAEWERGAK